MYRVTADFADGRDNMRVYRAGDIYPRAGFVADAQRIADLSGRNNAQGRPVIMQVPDIHAETAEPDAKPTRRTRAKK